MNFKEIESAVAMAQRFIKLFGELKTTSSSGYIWVDPGKESGALRRASLDLTRQLATMRRPG